MTSHADGTCLCGAVRYRVHGPLGEVRYCHCAPCRRATGTAFSANARVPADRFELLAGEEQLAVHEQLPGIFRTFCGACGTPIHGFLEREPDWRRVRIGGLTGRVDVRVTAHVWTSRNAAWHPVTGALPCYAEAAGSAGIPRPSAAPVPEDGPSLLTARCLCGDVQIEIAGKVGPLVHCHCSQCRTASGSAFSSNVDVRRRYWIWRAGEDRLREYTSSPGKVRAFCAG